MQRWACALVILGLSASILGHQFSYNTGAFHRSDDCRLCYHNDCRLLLDQARCEYYNEADKMIDRDEESEGFENPELKKDVDELIFDMVNKASAPTDVHMECIPYISRYTDCNKENICIGCKTCSCNSEGQWDCDASQQCKIQDMVLNIDHRVLVMVLENLIDANKPKKKKRSVTETTEEAKLKGSTITLEEMSEWLFGVKPSKMNIAASEAPHTTIDENLITEPTIEFGPISGLTTAKIVTKSPSPPDADYLAFDEVLRNIDVDGKRYNRRKLPLDNVLNKTLSEDYMIMDEDNMTISDLINYWPSDASVTKSPIDATTKIIIDLLEAAGNEDERNETRETDFFNKDEDLANDIEKNTNDIIEYNAAHIMKRDVSKFIAPNAQPTVTLIVNTTNTTNINDLYMDLKDSILVPLNNIIKDKKKELEDLNKIKKDLLKFLKVDNETYLNIVNGNNVSNSYFSVYNVAMDTDVPMNSGGEMYAGEESIYAGVDAMNTGVDTATYAGDDTAMNTGADIDLRRANPNGLDKLMFKIKTDIFEVLKDVMEIRKHKHSKLPEDVKIILRAMKRYVYKNKVNAGKINKLKSRKKMNTRRQMGKQAFGLCDFISHRDCIAKIIDVIDRDMPKSNALSCLSPTARRIMKHVIKYVYVDDLAVVGLRINDPNYNLTTDLKNIGNKWLEMTANVINGAPFTNLYRMKSLHITLTADIIKLNAALALVDFAHSRRMLHTLDTVNNDVLNKISNGLQAIHNKVQIIIRYYAKRPSDLGRTAFTETDSSTMSTPKELGNDSRTQKKRSFIKHIRSLLKSSKNDIAELLHRKIPKAEIVKQLARKKLDEISEKKYNEYQETMKKWQKKLDIMPRNKRSLLEKFKARIKNIIPNYLRHKVTPRIKEKKNNATNANAARKTEKKRKSKKHDNAAHGHKTTRRQKHKDATTPTSRSTVIVTPRLTKATTKTTVASMTTMNLNQTT